MMNRPAIRLLTLFAAGAGLAVAQQTSTTLASTTNSTACYQSINLTATVSFSPIYSDVYSYYAYPTGFVELYNYGASTGISAILTVNPNGNTGTATFVVPPSQSPQTSYSFTAVYPGDANFYGSQSAPAIAVSVIQPSLTASTSSVFMGQPVTFQVAGAPPSTGVTLNDSLHSPFNNNTVASGAGAATYSVSTLVAGNHSLFASFAAYPGCQSNAVAVTVYPPIATTTVLTNNPNPWNCGQPPTIALTATITAASAPPASSGEFSVPVPATPTGTVSFYNNSGLLVSTSNLVASGSSPPTAKATVTVQTTQLQTGSGNSLTAVYTPDAASLFYYSGSTSPAVGQTVNALSLMAPGSSVYGQQVTLAAGGVAAGASVTFTDNGAALSTLTVPASGNASFSTYALLAGTHTIAASTPGCSATTTITVSKAPTTTGVSSSLNPSALCQQVTLTGSLSSPLASSLAAGVLPPSSVVVLTVDGQPVQNPDITSGLSPGPHSVVATYPGDSNYLPSSSSLSQVVNTPTLTLSASPNPSTYGQTVTLTPTLSIIPASISPGAQVTVSFTDSLGATIPTATIGSGTSANVSIPNLAAGTHTITATSTWICGTTTMTAQVTVVVGPAATTTTLTPPPTSLFACTPLSLAATVVAQNLPLPPGVLSPTGTVTFSDAAGPVGSATVAASSGQATASNLLLQQGTHNLNASYASDTGNYSGSKSSSAPITINPLSLSLMPSATSVVVGQPLTLTATASPAPSSPVIVTFFDGGKQIGQATTNGSGVATISSSTLAIGSHTLTASFPACTVQPTVTSTPAAVTVITIATTLTLSAAASQSACQPATLTATISPAAAPGSVLFYDVTSGRKAIGGSLLSNGVATVIVPPFTAGPHQIEADYTPTDPTYATSVATAALTVSAIPTSTSLSAQPQSSASGQQVTLVATISYCQTAGSASLPLKGSVTFTDNSAPLATVPVSNAAASFSISTLAIGSHPITATFTSADTNYLGSSGSATVSVGKTPTTTQLTVDTLTSTFGQTITLTAMVQPPAATGTVTFSDGTQPLGSPQTLSGGQATLTIALQTAGLHMLTANYSGDANFAGGSSSTITESVGKAPSTTTLSASPMSPSFGQSVKLTATVGPAAGSGAVTGGSVTFNDGSAVLGSSPLVSGGASLSTSTLSAGSHTLTATYSGGDNFQGSQSNSVQVTVGSNQPPPAIQITGPPLSPNPPTSLSPQGVVGTPYSLTFTASGGTQPLTWLFAAGSTPPPGLTLNPQSGVLSGTPTTAGTFAFTVQVQDSSSPTPQTSPPGAYSLTVVNPPLPCVTLAVDQTTVNETTATIPQVTPTVTLQSGYPVDLAGTATLTFTPDTAVANLSSSYVNTGVAFAGVNCATTPCTSVTFTISANTASVTLPKVQVGTVAGSILITLTGFTPAGATQPLVPSCGQQTATVTLPPTKPVITPGSVKLTLNASSGSLQITLTGYSNTRELISADCVFNGTSGSQPSQLHGTTQNPSLSSASTALWGNSNADGTFALALPFTLAGDTSLLQSVQVTLTNKSGTSDPVSGTQ